MLHMQTAMAGSSCGGQPKSFPGLRHIPNTAGLADTLTFSIADATPLANETEPGLKPQLIPAGALQAKVTLPEKPVEVSETVKLFDSPTFMVADAGETDAVNPPTTNCVDTVCVNPPLAPITIKE